MWNDRDSPLAYLITFRTHGTWLHGDRRGSVSRHNNKYGSPKLRPEPRWLSTNSARLIGEPVVLNASQRECVKTAIKETCNFREWTLFAINVRTNHAHAVVSAGSNSPGVVLNALKSNATRRMREEGCWTSERSPWVDKGSNRYLWNEESLANACDYVEYGQGDELPNFD
jgi:REP element-mobilizing transposase RayT